MHIEDTIAAISTPLGYSGIGIVRLSGKDAIRIAERVFSSPRGKSLSRGPTHRLLYGHIIDHENGELIDEVLVSVMKAPNTYTREDIVEINCHGGPLPLRRVLELVLRHGARLAQPGEFTMRAFLNGRIDLAQSEAVLDIINSLTEEGQKVAMEQLRGGLSKRITGLREGLIGLTAIVEAYIDFPDEEITPPDRNELVERAGRIQTELGELISSSRYGLILREGVKTAIIGRPNVGKSSLLNALLQHDRAIVTEVPGTTRDIIEEYLNIKGLPVRIMDTAGIRDSGDIAEMEGVERSLRAMQGSDLVLLVLDGSEELHETDIRLIEESRTKDVIIVINKIDLPTRISPERLPPDKPLVRISALKGIGIEDLKEEIVDMSTKGRKVYEIDTPLVTRQRHLMALKRAHEAITSFLEGLDSLSPEILALELREALDALGEIIGITTPDDILNRIFSEFCIGK
jgi:tRNA modification GTPase